MRYKILEENVLEIREQLSLFETKQGNNGKSQQLVFEDWDFATANTKIETHGFHPYPAMMIPQIARSLILKYGEEGQTLLDPFCGSGTALVEAKLHGLNSYGIDINPLALLLARVKTTPLQIEELKKISLKLCNNYLKMSIELSNIKVEKIVPEFFNIEYWFHPNVSYELYILKSVIQKIKDIKIREFFLVAFSQTVREASYTRNGEFKLFRIPKEELPKHRPNILQIFFGIVQRNMQGMSDFMQRAKKVFAKILDEDTRTRTSIPSKTVDIIVTSPPYGDSITTVAYGQFSRLSLQWLGLPWEKVRNLDVNSIGGKKFPNYNELKKFPSLKETLISIEEENQKRAQDVASFFFDFQLCLKEINRVCKKGALTCFVVGNRTVKGVKIPTDQILAEMAEEFGFYHINTFQRNIPNKRMPLKNSPTNVEGVLGETMTKEHIVILRKSEDLELD